ncbi:MULTISPECIES: 4-carboxy-4-hydroxy-2-oxoadipate aldolase/oxaloacetate decarboxylase [Bosea]|jgi:4-hydroxy-4-methyl-2-oxoglutarate aldolase|uniref:4-carboxy-4-hydroxy-2-oxoadipate aldolase/oxaloacetate decarboxylase n=1 Tax=Bosea rubneri TaxID=3075434 RepID=A0ABU3S364_9HYPH|nr:MULTISPECIES: 4-carboxy-4-hydroxy-2-oxoadipate aldolase/oxaloacetate decarboxylase [unclassified Bosea (in: a-proteobacteria)]MBN9440738.1 4-carboxy-4-hydroxy-2-oxoadipate aldolase/oxaloacetate decarboxylase [Bosea sp. (in: a-proteobacteria)]MDU0339211.1 4-carboxy-4-hydroxy-2-oxoadipate aldolase/oxaloacetate decarboxylase [Bosea sp. ZW T0_25]HEV7335688.1 4-carboxy-4-hydroxy-2-oxoadipate aldolase/oxaloacetate decarboxylase [Bosea sp. (in: a-proteobacteria)]
MTEFNYREAYASVASATAHEAMERRGALDSSIKPVRRGMKVLGPAFTCVCPPGDNLTLHAALKMAKAGDVIVCASAGFTEQGLFGDVMASCAMGKGIGGLVVDGGVRDGATIAEIGFPVFARALSIKGSVKETLGALNKPIVAGGMLVEPGDLVIGDDDGVCIVPKAEIAAIAVASKTREEKEARFRRELLQGKTTWDMLNLSELLRKKGIELNI